MSNQFRTKKIINLPMILSRKIRLWLTIYIFQREVSALKNPYSKISRIRCSVRSFFLSKKIMIVSLKRRKDQFSIQLMMWLRRCFREVGNRGTTPKIGRADLDQSWNQSLHTQLRESSVRASNSARKRLGFSQRSNLSKMNLNFILKRSSAWNQMKRKRSMKSNNIWSLTFQS
jgi:ribosomal protein L21